MRHYFYTRNKGFSESNLRYTNNKWGYSVTAHLQTCAEGPATAFRFTMYWIMTAAIKTPTKCEIRTVLQFFAAKQYLAAALSGNLHCVNHNHIMMYI